MFYVSLLYSHIFALNRSDAASHVQNYVKLHTNDPGGQYLEFDITEFSCNQKSVKCNYGILVWANNENQAEHDICFYRREYSTGKTYINIICNCYINETKQLLILNIALHFFASSVILFKFAGVLFSLKIQYHTYISKVHYNTSNRSNKLSIEVQCIIEAHMYINSHTDI